jgi:signal transduction histidine kinase
LSSSNLPELLRYSAVGLVVVAALSISLGWLIAGRALRPLHLITTSARAISASDLDGRLRLDPAYREFAELADTLNGLFRRLADTFTAQQHFVANASHELRTPLAAQRTLLQVTLADPDATPQTLRAACTEVLALGEEQRHLIDALLSLANGRRALDVRQPFDLADVTRGVLLARRGDAERAGIHVEDRLAPAPAAGDPRLVESLIANLVDNALRYNVTGGTVEITTGATSAGGRISVANTGPVIPADEISRLFQPFQRHGPDRTRHDGGHGLGLAIVAAIAETHGATLTAGARPRGGLDIAVGFPAGPVPPP